MSDSLCYTETKQNSLEQNTT